MKSKSLTKPIWALPFKLIWIFIRGIFWFVFKDVSKAFRKNWNKPPKDYY